MDKPTFVYVTYIGTTPEKLWEALTDGEFMRKYWRRAETDWQEGSSYTQHKENGEVENAGVVLRSEPPRLLSFTFQPQNARGLAEPPSRVTFTIEPLGKLVRLTLTHDDFPADSQVLGGISNGWPGILSGLKSLMETGKPLPFGKWE